MEKGGTKHKLLVIALGIVSLIVRLDYRQRLKADEPGAKQPNPPKAVR
jgi:hypothetical protein